MSYRCPTKTPNYCDRSKQIRKGVHGKVTEKKGQCAERQDDCNRNFHDKKGDTGYCTNDPTATGKFCTGEPDYTPPVFVPQSASHHPKFPPASSVIADQSAVPSSYVSMTPQQVASSQLSTAVALQHAASKAPMTTEQRMAMKELSDAMAKLVQTMQTPKTDFTVPYTPSRRMDQPAQAAGSDSFDSDFTKPYAPSRPVTRSVTAAVPAPPAYEDPSDSYAPSTGVGYTPLDARQKERPTGPDESKGKKRRSKRRYSKKNRKSC